MPYSKTGTLQPRAPFDFGTSLAFLGMFPPMHGEQTITHYVLTKAVTIARQTVVFNIHAPQLEAVDTPELAYTLHVGQPISEAVERAAADRMAFFLSLNDDLHPFYALAEQDAAFAPVMRQWYGHHQVKFLTPFEHVCWAILTQRTPMMVAQGIKKRLMEKFGEALEVEGVTHRAFPEAGQLVDAADQLAEIVGNPRKADYLLSAAHAFETADEAWLRSAPSDDVEAWLRQIKGIGEWSARFVLIRGLGHMDRLSIGEGRFVDAVRERYGHNLSDAQIQEIAAGYGVYQGYWAYYLRISA